MTFNFASISGALLSLAMAAAPAALASSSAVSAQTQADSPALPTHDTLHQIDPVATDFAAAEVAAAPDQRHVECIAKIIMHEAADEPRPGRVAVAQVIRARIRDGRFAADACGVARQRGQFFDVDAFEPARSSPKWQDAVEIATQTLSGAGEDLVPGALFFHASYSPMPGRQRVGQIGGHVFYR